MSAASAVAPRAARAAAQAAGPLPLASPNGYSKIRHSYWRLAAVLSGLGEFAVLGLIEAYTSEGQNPPEWTGAWYDADNTRVTPVEYFSWITGLDERGVYKVLQSLRKKQLIEVQGEGMYARYKPRRDRYPALQSRPKRHLIRRKGPALENDPHQCSAEGHPVKITADIQPAKLDCPHGITCPVQGLRRGDDGLLRNVSPEKTSPEPSPEKTSPWEIVKAKLREVIAGAAWRNWVERTHQIEIQSGVAIVAADSISKEWLESEYAEPVSAALVHAGLTGVRYVIAEPIDSKAGNGTLLNSSSEDPFRDRLRRACARVPAVLEDTVVDDVRAVLHTPEAEFFRLLESKRQQSRLQSLGLLVFIAEEARRRWLDNRGLLRRLERRVRSPSEGVRQ